MAIIKTIAVTAVMSLSFVFLAANMTGQSFATVSGDSDAGFLAPTHTFEASPNSSGNGNSFPPLPPAKPLLSGQ